MDEKTDENKEQDFNTGTTIIQRVIEDEMKQSYLDYSMSVIVGRALPDVRDGLKPVHRRILYAMQQAGLFHNKPFRKSAFIVGRVMSEFHPHGDSAIYDSLVRMAQDFSLRYTLIDGQGNFGSIDGDNAAAMRYSEARLKKLAEEMLQDIEKRTVKFTPNFDNTSQEPSVLPSKIPNLLINGSSGIAVGMATNIPPHNMDEIIDGTIKQIDNPDITTEELLTHIKGPDFPTGATICGKTGITSAYKTGRGKVILRAKAKIEEIKDKKRILITEIPYMVNKSEMISHIADLVRDKKINGITDIRDESDRHGIRILIELKKGTNEDVILNQLYKHSRLQVTFGITMLALVNNVPKILTLKQMLQHYIDHRKDIVRKRTFFNLHKAQNRAHILEGLIIALDNLDKTIKLIKESKSVEEAKNSLITNFNLSPEQSTAILEMRLQRLTSLEQEKLKKEHRDLLKLIEELKSILQSPQKILDIIKKELLELKQNYADNRRTEIIDSEATSFEMEDIIQKHDCVITITHSGYIKRLPLQTYKQQKRGGKGLIATTTKDEDFVRDIFIASTHSYLLFFTNKGKAHWQKVYNIPEASRQAKGKAIINLIHLQQDEKITAYIPIEKFDDKHFLVMATKKGTIKKTNLSAYSKPRSGGIIAISLDAKDNLIGVKLTDGNKEILLATKNGIAVRFNETNVRPTGRSSQGVRGIRLSENDEVIGMVVATDQKTLLTVTENGYGKRTKISEYRLIARGGSGVRNIICSERNGKAVSVNSVSDEDEIMLITSRGITIRTKTSQISVVGRNTQGVKLISLAENDKLVGVAKIIRD
jgi:DNA gyrase subunit A